MEERAETSGPSAADARAPTPRMQVNMMGAPNSHIVAPTPQQASPALLHPYLMGASAAAAQYAAAGHSFLGSAAPGLRNPGGTLLLHQAIQLYQNPYLSPALTPQQLTALYYHQLAAAVAAGGVSLPVSTQAPRISPPEEQLCPAGPSGISYVAPARRRVEILAANNPNLARRSSAPLLEVGGGRSVREGQSPGEANWKNSGERSGRLSTTMNASGTTMTEPASMSKAKLSSPEAITEHISRLISENEAIVEPIPQLLSRKKSYRGQNCSTPTQPNGSDFHKQQQQHQSRATRSQSLVDPALLRQVNFLPHSQLLGGIPSNRAAVKPSPSLQDFPGSAALLPPTSPNSKGAGNQCECRFCGVGFSNEKSLDAHVFRCTHNPSGRLPTGPCKLEEVGDSSSKASSNEEVGMSSPAGSHSSSVTPPHKISQPISGPTDPGRRSAWSNHPLKKRILIAEAEAASPAKLPKLELPSPPKEAPRIPPVKAPLTRAATEFSVIPPKRPPLEQKHSQPTLVTGPIPAFEQAVAPLPIPNPHLVLVFPQVSLSSAEKNRSFSPYCVTVKVPGAQSFEAPRSGRRPKHVTAPTFVCLKRPQPMSLFHSEPKLSMYSTWQQAPVNPLEAKLNVLWMSGCCTRPRRGSPYWKYTVASKELSVARMTHSSFWEVSKKAQEQKQQRSPNPVQTPQVLLANQKLSIATQTTNTISHATTPKPSDFQPPNKAEAVKVESPAAEPLPDIKEKLRGALLNPQNGRKRLWNNLFSRTDEKYTYVRGRGRGRYVCELCGIRCRKPSMLQKHMRTHQNVRPFACSLCSFNFKTKGNLTKHLKSKTHAAKTLRLERRARLMKRETSDTDYDSDENRLEIDSTAGSTTESADEGEENGVEDGERINEGSMDGDHIYIPEPQYYWLPHRSVHTPPAEGPQEVEFERNCESLPPELATSSQSLQEAVRDLIPASTSSSSISGRIARLAEGLSGRGKRPDESPNSKASHYLFPSKGAVKCEQCDKEFPDQGKLRLHTYVHSYEQQKPSRRSVYTCSICNAQLRTKAQLQKHVASLHGSQENQDKPPPLSQPPATDQETPRKKAEGRKGNSKGVQGPHNPRPFYCQDCDKGFRIQGHLAKHLRSKQHITHLEMLEKLPLGFYAAIEASKGVNLAEDLDTTDCDTCLLGLRELSSKINLAPLPKEEKRPATVSSLACTEQMAVSPSPPPQLTSPPTSIGVSDPDTPSGSEQSEGSAQKSIIADVWVPPKESDIPAPIATKKPPEPQPHAALEKKDSVSPETSTSSGSAEEASGQSYRCHFCKQDFPTSPELEIHLHADHIAMRDGNDFKCPRANCDKVFPSKDNLRIHIAAHFNASAALSNCSSNGVADRDGDVSRETMVALQRKLGTAGGAQGPSTVTVPAGTVGNQSPGTPEESQTSIAAINGGRKKMKTHLVALNSIPEAVGVAGEFKSPNGGNNSPSSETSDGASRASSSHSSSPLPLLVGGPATLGKPLNKRKSMEQDSNGLLSPLSLATTAKRSSSPDGRRCISASEHSPRSTLSNYFSPLGGVRLQSNSMPAVPAQLRLGSPSELGWAPFFSPQLLYQHGFHNSPFLLSGLGEHLRNGVDGQNGVDGHRNGVDGHNHHHTNGVGVEEEKPTVVCPVCGKVLPETVPLQDHLLLHIQARPFICEHCDAGYTTAAGLKAHVITHQHDQQNSVSSPQQSAA